MISADPVNLKFLSTVSLDNIASSIKTFSANDWLGYVEAVLNEPDATMELEWTYGTPAPCLSPSVDDDGNSAIAIHKYLNELSPQQASDRRLWSFLSIGQFREYTAARWSLDAPSLKGKWQGRAEERWLVRSSSRAGMVRNSIGRLWWAAALTEDLDGDLPLTVTTGDPYAYTRVLLEKQDRFVNIVEREFGTRGHLLFALLDQVHLREGAYAELFARELAKEITLMGGFREVHTLEAERVRQDIDAASGRVETIIAATQAGLSRI